MPQPKRPFPPRSSKALSRHQQQVTARTLRRHISVGHWEIKAGWVGESMVKRNKHVCVFFPVSFNHSSQSSVELVQSKNI